MQTELKIVVNNSNKNQFNGFFESVKANILRQARKELLVAEGRKTMKPSCNAPFVVQNNIEQIKNQTI